MGSLSLGHWIIVLVIVLLVFGPARLGQVGKGLGEGIKSFKKGLADEEPPPPPQRQLSESSEPRREAWHGAPGEVAAVAKGGEPRRDS